MGAPFFPYDGFMMLVETDGGKENVEEFVKNDPYVKNNLVSKYEIKEFEVESSRRFERIASEFTYRS